MIIESFVVENFTVVDPAMALQGLVPYQKADLSPFHMRVAKVNDQDDSYPATSVVDVLDSFILSMSRRLGLGDFADRRW